MTSRAIITSCSNKFFPSALNLIGSIREFHTDMTIYVYDLGLSRIFRSELASIPGIIIRDFDQKTKSEISHWRSCYTWKSIIFKNPEADINLYLDAGNEALRSLDGMFDEIHERGYIAVEQGIALEKVTPPDYVSLFGISDETLSKPTITAGVFGFKRDDAAIADIINRLYNASVAGLCLGFSANELWKNKGVNKNPFVRNCAAFRHDTTLLSVLLYTHMPNFIYVKAELHAGGSNHLPGQYLWNMRMNYIALNNMAKAHSLATRKSLAKLNTGIIRTFVFLKNIRLAIKKSLKLA